MKQQTLDADRAAGAAFFPYGLDRGAAPAPGHLHPGAAEVVGGDGQRGIEVYALERAAEHWQLYSKAFDQPWRLLARVHHARLAAEPMDAAAELLIDLWSLRQTGRLSFARRLESGELGRLRWRRIEARIPKTAPLEQALRAEGHQVRAVPGPVGTTEHVLLLRRASA
jgi:hypothetical protein